MRSEPSTRSSSLLSEEVSASETLDGESGTLRPSASSELGRALDASRATLKRVNSELRHRSEEGVRNSIALLNRKLLASSAPGEPISQESEMQSLEILVQFANDCHSDHRDL